MTEDEYRMYVQQIERAGQTAPPVPQGGFAINNPPPPQARPLVEGDRSRDFVDPSSAFQDNSIGPYVPHWEQAAAQQRALDGTAARANAMIHGASPYDARLQQAAVTGRGLPGPRSPRQTTPSRSPADLGPDPSTAPGGGYQHNSRAEVLRQANAVLHSAQEKQSTIQQLLKQVDPRTSKSAVAVAAQAQKAVAPRIDDDEEIDADPIIGIGTAKTLLPIGGVPGYGGGRMRYGRGPTSR